MEILTNFETLIYIYLAITVATLIYPIELIFRANFVNFIFMILITTFIMLFKIDLFFDVAVFLREDFYTFYFILFGSILGVLFYFRVTGNYTIVDSLFLGLLPYTVVYFLLLYNFYEKLNGIIVLEQYVILIGLFLIPYAIFIYKKMLITMPFSVKSMGDNY